MRCARAEEAVKLAEYTSIPEKLKGSGELRIAGYGGTAQDAQRKAYYEPFGRLAGVKVMDFAGANINKVKAMVETKQRRVGRGPAQPRHRAQPDEARRLFRE